MSFQSESDECSRKQQIEAFRAWERDSNVMRNAQDKIVRIGENATKGGEEMAVVLVTGESTTAVVGLEACYCFTMTPQAILGPPGASFVGGSGKYLSGSSWMIHALPS